MLLAIIPARGGSKGVPRKNVRLLNGKPLIQYSIEAARESSYVDDILLSTDDDEIIEIGRSLGLNVEYRRPAELAGDTSSMINALEHGLHWYESSRGGLPDEVLLLQPTSPLRSVADIDGAVKLMRESGCRSVVGVHPMVEHPCECISGSKGDWHYLLAPPEGAARRQDYVDDYFYINGAIYLARTEFLLSQRSFIHPQETSMFVMPRERGVDIDTEMDMIMASAMLAAQQGDK